MLSLGLFPGTYLEFSMDDRFLYIDAQNFKIFKNFPNFEGVLPIRGRLGLVPAQFRPAQQSFQLRGTSVHDHLSKDQFLFHFQLIFFFALGLFGAGKLCATSHHHQGPVLGCVCSGLQNQRGKPFLPITNRWNIQKSRSEFLGIFLGKIL